MRRREFEPFCPSGFDIVGSRRKHVDLGLQRIKNPIDFHPGTLDGLGVLFEQIGVLAAIEAMKRMTLQKYRQVFAARDDVFASGHEEASGLQHSANLTTKLLEVSGMVQHLPAVHEIERVCRKGQFFAPGLRHVDVQRCVSSEPSDRFRADACTGIGFQRRGLPSVAGQRIRRDTSTGAHVQRDAALRG